MHAADRNRCSCQRPPACQPCHHHPPTAGWAELGRLTWEGSVVFSEPSCEELKRRPGPRGLHALTRLLDGTALKYRGSARILSSMRSWKLASGLQRESPAGQGSEQICGAAMAAEHPQFEKGHQGAATAKAWGQRGRPLPAQPRFQGCEKVVQRSPGAAQPPRLPDLGHAAHLPHKGGRQCVPRHGVVDRVGEGGRIILVGSCAGSVDALGLSRAGRCCRGAGDQHRQQADRQQPLRT
jgi:hypothetical protein